MAERYGLGYDDYYDPWEYRHSLSYRDEMKRMEASMRSFHQREGLHAYSKYIGENNPVLPEECHKASNKKLLLL